MLKPWERTGSFRSGELHTLDRSSVGYFTLYIYLSCRSFGTASSLGEKSLSSAKSLFVHHLQSGLFDTKKNDSRVWRRGYHQVRTQGRWGKKTKSKHASIPGGGSHIFPFWLFGGVNYKSFTSYAFDWNCFLFPFLLIQSGFIKKNLIGRTTRTTAHIRPGFVPHKCVCVKRSNLKNILT